MESRTPRPDRSPVSRSSCLVLVAVAATAVLAVPGLAAAEIPGLTWHDPEIVATGVPEIPSSPGQAAAHTPPWSIWGDLEEWHVVYEVSGHVFHQVRTDAWQPAEQLTSEGAAAKNPKLAFHSNALHVVWEDARTGHPEVWSRDWYGEEWSDEVCVTCDETESRAPVVAGDSHHALLVWEEGPDGASRIDGSLWISSVGWGPAGTISESTGSAFEPTVDVDFGGSFRVAWADTRHGDAEIYFRRVGDNGSMGAESRATNMSGACRRPDVRIEYVGGDVIEAHTLIAFENDQTGVPEVWTVCDQEGMLTDPQRISDDDGVPSTRPNACSYDYDQEWDPFGYTAGQWYVTWTDRPESALAGTATHHVSFFPDCDAAYGEDTLSFVGASTSSLGGIGAYWSTPDAEIIALWVEDDDGEPILYARRGNRIGCLEPDIQGPLRSFIVAPAGLPADSMFAWNACGDGQPFEGEFELDFSQIDTDLTWDEAQQHPVIGPQPIDEQGYSVFEIRGGGCAEDAVTARISGVTVYVLYGVASPDLDGDCVVTFEDLLLLIQKLGTDDFCADLDGSGTVDEADAAIVEATMGDHCTQVSSVDGAEDGATTGSLGLRVFPNPIAWSGAITLNLDELDTASIRIVDVGGRLVRDLGVLRGPGGGPGRGVLTWNTRDQAGRPVVSGVYYVVAEAGTVTATRSILVVR